MTSSPSSPSAETKFALPSDTEIVMTRVFDAPPELVYAAFTEARHLAQWWGPHGFTNPVCEMDARPGGAWRMVQRDSDGNEFPFKGVFREVVPAKKVVFTQIFDVEPYSKSEMVVTTTFESIGGDKTQLTSMLVFPSGADRDGAMAMGMQSGMVASNERLDALLQTLGRMN
jgi:uncharacterized protein YndB with AHSA1/START domain